MNQNNTSNLNSLPAALGALLAEYRKAIDELIWVINSVTPQQFTSSLQTGTNKPGLQSVQSILTHVIWYGYQYMAYFGKFISKMIPGRVIQPVSTVHEYTQQLQALFLDTLNFFTENPNLELVQINPSKKIIVSWGQQYDLEQLLEHAIVHVLRHRRQIENILLLQKPVTV